MCKAAERVNYPYEPLRPPTAISNLLALAAWEDHLNFVCRNAGIAPIFVENWIDDERAPENFTFIQGNILHESARKLIKVMDIDYNCACNGQQYCNRGQCCASVSYSNYYLN
jgi:hypothetical protein